ncbi:hypothetical protein LTR66_000364 [Elasticomyces elasticus]|nr:hypothetical protein LTR66_000364 [Elasticomyces elasticus]
MPCALVAQVIACTGFEYPMNSDRGAVPADLEKAQSVEYTSSGSESRQTPSGSAKKRASRAGTRSVTTLSVAQLERKRANDREAQRAIRQRTKDHIDSLEKQIADQQGTSERLLAVQERNRQLEEENAYLRSRVREASLPVGTGDKAASSDDQAVPASSVSDRIPTVNIPRPASTSTRRSLSNATTQSAASLTESWQPGAGYSPAESAPPFQFVGAHKANVSPNLPHWRPQENLSIHPRETHRIVKQESTHMSSPDEVDKTPWQSSMPNYSLTPDTDNSAMASRGVSHIHDYPAASHPPQFHTTQQLATYQPPQPQHHTFGYAMATAPPTQYQVSPGLGYPNPPGLSYQPQQQGLVVYAGAGNPTTGYELSQHRAPVQQQPIAMTPYNMPPNHPSYMQSQGPQSQQASMSVRSNPPESGGLNYNQYANG